MLLFLYRQHEVFDSVQKEKPKMFKLTALQSNTDTKGQQPNPIAFKEILVLILYCFFFFWRKFILYSLVYVFLTKYGRIQLQRLR